MATAKRRLTLEVKSKEDFKVVHFTATEGLSQPFVVQLHLQSPKPDIDLEKIVGLPASFTSDSAKKHAKDTVRLWKGICNHIELGDVETSKQAKGQCTYVLSIVPRLWLLTQRSSETRISPVFPTQSFTAVAPIQSTMR